MAKRCPCADPPRGEITCADDQFGICGVIDGKLVVGCFDIPARVSRMTVAHARQNAIENWALSRITGVNRSDSQPISYQERQILRTGEYVHPGTGHAVKFSLPQAEEEPESQASPMAQSR